MKKNIFLSVLIWLSFYSYSSAETIYLKNGTVVQGRVLEKGTYYIIIESKGIPDKYFVDQIDRVVPDEQSESATSNPTLNISPVKLDLIRKLIEVNGTRRSIQKNFDLILSQIPAEKREKASDLFKTDEIIERILPVYDNNFSEQELSQLITFYQSPIGQKALAVSPKIMSEALEVTVKYFEEKLKK